VLGLPHATISSGDGHEVDRIETNNMEEINPNNIENEGINRLSMTHLLLRMRIRL